uniref:hypothetical protein n=1 Tax=Siminovitchia fortis TaxID=254758 RepID=UPI001C92E495
WVFWVILVGGGEWFGLKVCRGEGLGIWEVGGYRGIIMIVGWFGLTVKGSGMFLREWIRIGGFVWEGVFFEMVLLEVGRVRGGLGGNVK